MILQKLFPLWIAVLVVMPVPVTARVQEAGTKAATESYPVPDRLIESLEGAELFRSYCAVCHGKDAKGGGPAASSLKAQPPDLTRVAQRRGGRFSIPEVEKIISGEETVATHGSREMPIWGPIFGQIQRDQNLGKIRIRNLAKYLESLQVK